MTTIDDDRRGSLTMLDLLDWHRQQITIHADDAELRFFHEEAVDILELTCAAGCTGLGFDALREDEERRRKARKESA